MGNENSRSSKPIRPRPIIIANPENDRRGQANATVNYTSGSANVGKADTQKTPPSAVPVGKQPPSKKRDKEAVNLATVESDKAEKKFTSTSSTGVDASSSGIQDGLTTATVSDAAVSKNKKKRKKNKKPKDSSNSEGTVAENPALDQESSEDDEDEEVRQSFMRLGVGEDQPQTDNYIDPQRIQISRLVGQGGFGSVFHATLNGVTKVVSKFIMVPFVVEEDELNQLLSLKHRNFATVIGVVRQTCQMDPPQLILCYYPEGNVLQFLNSDENPKDNGTLGKFAFDITEGCQFLHACNVVHGNLAARNVLVQKIPKDNKIYYNAKISDFGIIRYAEPSGANYMRLPENDDMVVPLRWVPKEMIDGSTPDFTFSSDMWSFGVVLWEMWTKGAIPYGATYSNPRIIQFLRDGSSPLKVHRPTGCPKNIVAVMESAFQVDPLERPTFTELLPKLQHFKGHGTIFAGTTGAEVGGGGAAQPSQSGKPLAGTGSMKEQAKNMSSNLKEGEKSQKKNKEKAKTSNSCSESAPSHPTGVAGDNAGGGKPKGTGSSGKPPKANPNQKGKDSSVDSEVEALRKKVAQLEKEKQSGGGGHVGGGRGSQGQEKRGSSKPPRSGRGGGGRGGDFHQGAAGMHAPGRASGSSPSPYPPAAPPPYTEQPLPFHSSPHPQAQLPQYVFGQGGGGYGGPAVKDDPTEKMKRLEQEMALVKAEKLMQEAKELMNKATGSEGTTESRSTAIPPGSKFSDPPLHSMPPHQFGGDQYYADGHDAYGGAPHGGPVGHRGHRQGSGTGQSHQWRPYNKSRGGGRARGRAGHNNEAH